MKECTDVVLTRNQASKYVFNGRLLSVQIRAGYRFVCFHGQLLTFQISIDHHLNNLCESLPILIKLDGSMMELRRRSAIQVLGISLDRRS